MGSAPALSELLARAHNALTLSVFLGKRLGCQGAFRFILVTRLTLHSRWHSAEGIVCGGCDHAAGGRWGREGGRRLGGLNIIHHVAHFRLWRTCAWLHSHLFSVPSRSNMTRSTAVWFVTSTSLPTNAGAITLFTLFTALNTPRTQIEGVAGQSTYRQVHSQEKCTSQR